MTIKLHLGCGPREIPGFVHVDVVPFGHVDIVGSVHCLPLRDESAELIYASHVLEHFGRAEYLGVLAEWRRVLRKGGVLRLAVPDFAACVSEYHENGIANGITGLVGLVVGGQRNVHDFHKMIFDEPFLTGVLHRLGFTDVRRWDWRRTEHAHIDDFSQAFIPHMAKDSGRLMSLNLEARRAG